MRRRLIRILLGLGALIALAIIVVQIVLWTDLPRDLVLGQLQRQLGLRAGARTLSTGWLGHTTLRDVTLGLPLSDEAFLQMPTLEVSHTTLLGMAFGRPLEVDAVTMRSPVLIVRQDERGQWNLQLAARMIARTSGGAAAPEQQAPTPSARLPELMIHEATIQIIDSAGRQTSVAPLEVHGRAESPLVYAYRAGISGHMDLSGRLVPKGQWRHEVAFDLQRLDSWVRPWVRDWPDPVAAHGRWDGHLSGGGVSGQLTLEKVQVQQYTLQGAVDVQAGGGAAIVTPRRLSVTSSQGGPWSMALVGGQIRAEGATLTLDELLLSIAGGQVRLDGRLGLADREARLSAEWEQLHLPSGVTHDGNAELDLSTPWPNQPQLSLQVASTGAGGGGYWDVNLGVRAKGQNWSNTDWTVELSKASYRGAVDLDLRDLTAQGRWRGSEMFLDTLSLADPGTIAGKGYINLADTFGDDGATPPATQPSATWYLWLDGANWQVPTVAGIPTRFVLNGWGNGERVALEQLYAAFGELQASGSGTYVFARPEPLDLDFYLLNLPTSDAGGGGGADRPPVRGKLRAEGHIAGTLRPRRLEIRGNLIGEDVAVMNRPLGDLTVALSGQVMPDKSTLRSKELELLGGKWQFSAVYPDQPRTLRVGVEASDLALREVADLVGAPELSGTISGNWFLDMPQLDRDRLRITGTYSGANLRLGTLGAQALNGTVRLNDGTLLANARLRQAEGEASITLSLPMAQPDQLTLSLAAADWPVASGAGTLLLSANADKLQIDPRALTANGALGATLAASYRDQPLGTLALQARLSGRRVDIHQLGGELFGGALSGDFAVDLDRTQEARGQLRWTGIDTHRLRLVWPALAPLAGEFDGVVAVAPEKDPRALGPLRVNARLTARNGRFNALDIGSAQAAGYASLSAGKIPGLNRFVLEQARLAVADGTVDLWGRVSRHAGGPLSSQLIVEFSGLNLDQLVQALKPGSKPMPGRLSGRFTGVGNPRDPSRLYAQGEVAIGASDLGNFGPINALYDTMHLQGDREPTGEGRVQLRLEAGQIIIPQARYFNRGVQAIAAGSLTDIFLGRNCPVNATLVGSARPLKNLDLPFMADVDQIFQAIQTNVTTVRIDGTVGTLRWAIVPFQEVGQGIREILFGEVRSR